jgi:hypothetical protein
MSTSLGNIPEYFNIQVPNDYSINRSLDIKLNISLQFAALSLLLKLLPNALLDTTILRGVTYFTET